MDFFEFILIITSIIYALCIAPLLSGVVRILQSDSKVRFYLPQAALALYLFISVVQLWWTMWWFRDVNWHFATYFFMVLEPSIMYLTCSLIFPHRLDGEEVSLEAHYFKIRVPFLIANTVVALLAYSDGVVMGIETLWHARRYVQIIALAIMMWALIDKRKMAQYVCAVGLVVIQLVFIGIWFWAPVG